MTDFLSKLPHVLFVDIETVTRTPDYESLSPGLQKAWDRKASFLDHTIAPSLLYSEKAAIYAEFGKIICIATGFFFLNEQQEWSFRVKCFSDPQEKTLLENFCQLLETKYRKKRPVLCAHNGREFDYPYICRRLLANNLDIPKTLNPAGKKPWEIEHLDTLEMWKFGDRKNFTSLDLLATLFDIPGCKDDMDGSMVHEVYYHESNLEKIARYCSGDVVTTAQLYLKLHNKSLIPEDNIFIL